MRCLLKGIFSLSFSTLLFLSRGSNVTMASLAAGRWIKGVRLCCHFRQIFFWRVRLLLSFESSECCFSLIQHGISFAIPSSSLFKPGWQSFVSNIHKVLSLLREWSNSCRVCYKQSFFHCCVQQFLFIFPVLWAPISKLHLLHLLFFSPPSLTLHDMKIFHFLCPNSFCPCYHQPSSPLHLLLSASALSLLHSPAFIFRDVYILSILVPALSLYVVKYVRTYEFQSSDIILRFTVQNPGKKNQKSRKRNGETNCVCIA